MSDMPLTHVFSESSEKQWMPISAFVNHERNHKGPGSEPDPNCPFCKAGI